MAKSTFTEEDRQKAKKKQAEFYAVMQDLKQVRQRLLDFGLTSKRVDAIVKRMDEMTLFWRIAYFKSLVENSLRWAVNAFCGECVCWDKEEIRNCTALACPLYGYRPYE